jgi:hypothetical protein
MTQSKYPSSSGAPSPHNWTNEKSCEINGDYALETIAL